MALDPETLDDPASQVGAVPDQLAIDVIVLTIKGHHEEERPERDQAPQPLSFVSPFLELFPGRRLTRQIVGPAGGVVPPDLLGRRVALCRKIGTRDAMPGLKRRIGSPDIEAHIRSAWVVRDPQALGDDFGAVFLLDHATTIRTGKTRPLRVLFVEVPNKILGLQRVLVAAMRAGHVEMLLRAGLEGPGRAAVGF